MKPEVGDKGGSSTDEEVKWKIESESKISTKEEVKWKIKSKVQWTKLLMEVSKLSK